MVRKLVYSSIVAALVFGVIVAFGLLVGWTFDHIPLTGYYPEPRGNTPLPSAGDIARYLGVFLGAIFGIALGIYLLTEWHDYN